mgnify:CR=1 FL=1
MSQWTPELRAQRVDAILSQAPVLPVLSIADADDAVPLARALVDGGLLNPVPVAPTLRTLTDAGMAALRAEALTLAQQIATAQGLTLDHSWHDDFAACRNDPQATALFHAAIAAEGLPFTAFAPMRASEDFGRFGGHARAAMAFLGSGESCPPLHAPDYDFPDALIAPALSAFHRLIRDLCG